MEPHDAADAGSALKTLGLIGGMSPASTVPYYQLINTGVGARLGGLHSARMLLYSVDFHDIEQLQRSGEWERAGGLLADAARVLHRGGAELIVLCTNTMHRCADAIAAAVPVPLLHIADATAAAVQRAGIASVGLLGTRYTMEQDFYRRRLEAHGLTVLVPDPAQRAEVDRVIFDELCHGRCEPASRAAYRDVIAALVARGAGGVILGCTEIGLLVGAGDSPVPLFDTTALHAAAAVEAALAGDG